MADDDHVRSRHAGRDRGRQPDPGGAAEHGDALVLQGHAASLPAPATVIRVRAVHAVFYRAGMTTTHALVAAAWTPAVRIRTRRRALAD
ncbi:hypothetical protein GCM10007977_032870 [Dactylosporangium sucinum]|uniref:Uncharacterized protein n=1 Tax=Dactylosporangium sucinum TaxID=1424081 RepID=A0A917WU55_9ACTN|nr:hypothetical protein GCM10007977_032870 [Dactylosporangium sucinum]